MNKASLLSQMGTADAENPLDEDNDNCYYMVTDDGSLGFTQNNGNNVYWIYRRAGSVPPPVNPQQPMQQAGGYGQPYSQQPMQPVGAFAAQNPVQFAGVPTQRVGFSNRINTAEFQNAVQKGKKSRRGCLIVIAILPIIVLPIASYYAEGTPLLTGLMIGLVVSALILLLSFITSLSDKFKKPWEGVVEKKDEKTVHVNRHDDEYRDDREIHLRVHIRCDNGKKRVIDEKEKEAVAYHYFRIGDRVRYHAHMGLAFPYEKYDKSNDTTIICPFCRGKVDINQPYCSRCKSPLLN